jgi:geranylgeranyl diphosphate synthase type II
MEQIQAYFKEKADFINAELKSFMANEEPLLEGLQESVNYTLFSGGKRIRPLFCIMVGELLNVSREKLISLACSLEMIHTASLIMDDLPHMDDAQVRRGKPANHMVYGQDVAALASIGLLTRAYEVVLNDPILPDDKKTQIVSKLANAVGINGMVGGQFVDLKFSDESMEYSTLEYIHIFLMNLWNILPSNTFISTRQLLFLWPPEQLLQLSEMQQNKKFGLLRNMQSVLDSLSKFKMILWIQ